MLYLLPIILGLFMLNAVQGQRMRVAWAFVLGCSVTAAIFTMLPVSR